MPTSLTAADVEQISLGGSVVETHDAIAATEMQIDFVHNSITVAFVSGTPANNTYIPGVHGTAYWVKINTATGDWTSSLGTSGTLTALQLATLNSNLKNSRNGSEGLANLVGIIPGTIVVWT